MKDKNALKFNNRLLIAKKASGYISLESIINSHLKHHRTFKGFTPKKNKQLIRRGEYIDLS